VRGTDGTSPCKVRKPTKRNLERFGKPPQSNLIKFGNSGKFTIDLPLRRQSREKPFWRRVYGRFCPRRMRFACIPRQVHVADKFTCSYCAPGEGNFLQCVGAESRSGPEGSVFGPIFRGLKPPAPSGSSDLQLNCQECYSGVVGGPVSRKARRAASSSTGIFNSWALSSLEPASSPATT
jgi:hypothetical protein